MTDKGSLTIKGIRDGLRVQVDPEGDWTALIRQLLAQIDRQASFFQGARLVLDVGRRPVRKHELGSLQVLLDKRGVVLSAVLSESMTTLSAARKLGLPTTLEPAAGPGKAADGAAGGRPPDATPVAETLLKVDEGPPPIASEEAGTRGVLVKRTLRSGRTVRSDGHVVVLGDVNPGAEVVAGGDIVVWGRLRGVVHAGAHGDETAVVCALDMVPTQLRIAGHIATSPEEKRHKPRPEMAVVRDRRIVVETWKG